MGFSTDVLPWFPPVWVTHAEVVSPLADSLDATWRRLCAGEGAVRPLDVGGRFAAGTPGYAALVPGLEAKSNMTAGRSLLLSLLDKLATRMKGWPVNKGRLFLYVSSAKAGIDVLERNFGQEYPVAAWKDVLPAGIRDWAKERLHCTPAGGENVAAACASGAVAIIRAAQAIAKKRCDVALVLAADIISPFTQTGFAALRAVSEHPCKPFDVARDGLNLGEGAAALLLMAPEFARKHGYAPMGALCGWGLASDARHITAPAKDARGLRAALHAALERSGKQYATAGICAHGTGTVYNDAMELTAFEHVFADIPPFFTAKGALGHSMAASGAMEAAFCLQALRELRIPPTVGLTAPEPRCQGKAAAACQTLQAPALVSCNAGFGGANAVLAFTLPGGAS